MNNFYRKILIPLFFLSVTYFTIAGSGGNPTLLQKQSSKTLIPTSSFTQRQASLKDTVNYLNYGLEAEPSYDLEPEPPIDLSIEQVKQSISNINKTLAGAKKDTTKAVLSKELTTKKTILENLQMKKEKEITQSSLDLNAEKPTFTPKKDVITPLTAERPALSFEHIEDKIDRPIDEYVLKSKKNLKTQVADTDIIDEIAPIYTIALINARGDMFGRGSKVQITEMDLSQDWNTDRPAPTQKIAAGLDAIKAYPKTVLDNSYFEPNTTMVDYVQALKENFPEISDQLLTQSVTTILQAVQSGQPRLLYGKHPTLTPKQIAENPKWPNHLNSEDNLVDLPTNHQKVYAMLDGMTEVIRQNQAGPTSISMVNQIARAVQTPIDSATSLGKAAVVKIGQSIAPELTTIINKIQTDPANTLVQEIIPMIKKWKESKPSSKAPELTQDSWDLINSEIKSATGLEIDLNQSTENIMQQIKTLATEKATKVVIDTFNITSEDNVALPTPQPQDSAAPEQTKILPKPTEIAATMQTSKTHGMAYTALRASARKMTRTPESIKNIIKSAIDTFIRFMNLSKKEALILNQNISVNKEYDQLKNDKSSWVNAEKKADFNYKFDIWIQSFTYRLTSIVNGKHPKSVEIIHINQNINNPLAPKFSIAYNASTKSITHIQISYQGNEYTVKPTTPTSVNEIITCKIPLISKPRQQNLFQKLQTDTYNKLVAETAGNGLERSQIEQFVPGAGKAAQDALTAKQNGPDRFITLIYNTKEGTIKTEETKILSSTTDKHSAKVTTTATYGQNTTNPDLKIAISDNNIDLFVPKITLDYSPNESPDKLGKLTSLSLEHQAKTGFKEVIDFRSEPKDIALSNDKKSFIITSYIIDRPSFAPLNRADQAAQNFSHALQDAAPKLVDNIIKGFAAGEVGGTMQHQLGELFNTAKKGVVDATKYGQSPERLGIDKVVTKYTPSTGTVEVTITTTMSRGEPQTKTLMYQV